MTDRGCERCGGKGVKLLYVDFERAGGEWRTCKPCAQALEIYSRLGLVTPLHPPGSAHGQGGK